MKEYRRGQYVSSDYYRISKIREPIIQHTQEYHDNGQLHRDIYHAWIYPFEIKVVAGPGMKYQAYMSTTNIVTCNMNEMAGIVNTLEAIGGNLLIVLNNPDRYNIEDCYYFKRYTPETVPNE